MTRETSKKQMTTSRTSTSTVSTVPIASLKVALDALMDQRDVESTISQDPIQFAHRYTDPKDQELAAIFASMLAFGKVTLFIPVIERWMALCDERGGPRHCVEKFSSIDFEAFNTLSYRWNKPPDFILIMLTFQSLLQTNPQLSFWVESLHLPEDTDLNPTLTRMMTTLHHHAVKSASLAGISATHFSDLPDGFRRFLSSPAKGSACKRWQMLLRWMVRDTEPDLGLWNLPIGKLTIPLDTHVHSISRMIGLTKLRSANLKAAQEITKHLRQIAPNDPIQYDFALAHLGISGQCKKTYNSEICTHCHLHDLCVHTKGTETREEKEEGDPS